jgi:hypothetical protein
MKFLATKLFDKKLYNFELGPNSIWNCKIRSHCLCYLGYMPNSIMKRMEANDVVTGFVLMPKVRRKTKISLRRYGHG